MRVDAKRLNGVITPSLKVQDNVNQESPVNTASQRISIQDTDVPTNQASASAKQEAIGELPMGKHPVSTTVALLPLQAEEEPMRSREWSLTANEGVGPNARLRARPLLTAWRWAGNVDAAARVADNLVDNAFRHGQSFTDGCITLRFALFPNDELLIEVSDARAEFPDFDLAVAAEPAPQKAPSGLWWVRHYQGRLSWRVSWNDEGESTGKTVQAILPPSWAAPA
ncbi:ATP-binding protein [Streptomyces sp. NPDC054834]